MENTAEELVERYRDPRNEFRDMCHDLKGRLTLAFGSYTCTVSNPKLVRIRLSNSGNAIVEDIE